MNAPWNGKPAYDFECEEPVRRALEQDRCRVCGRRELLAAGGIAIVDAFDGLEPRDMFTTGVIAAHERCAPDGCVWIPFARLLNEGSLRDGGWIERLRHESWYNDEVRDALMGAETCLYIRDRYGPEAEPAPEVLALRPPRLRPRRSTPNPRAISPRIRAAVFERDGFRCRRCGVGPDDGRLVVDHINPVAKGGTAATSNLQTLCQPCNAGKAARPPHEHDLRGR